MVVALHHLLQLIKERSRIYTSPLSIHTMHFIVSLTSSGFLIFRYRMCCRVALNAIYFGPDLRVIGRIQPYVFPVPITNARRQTGSNSIQHELQCHGLVTSGSWYSNTYLRWVYVGRANSTIAREIIPKNSGILSNVTKIYGFSTSLE